MTRSFRLILCTFFLGTLSLEAAIRDVSQKQRNYEREINAVVRNKLYYKPGKFEFTLTGGFMPFDSDHDHFMLGGKLTWHFSDHYAWEVIDFQKGMPSITNFSNNIATQISQISTLRVPQYNFIATTNFILSPLYGKMQLFGQSAMYFDLYFLLGGGMVNNQTHNLAHTSTTTAPTVTTLPSKWEPTASFGLGIKLFMSKRISVNIDLRDYLMFLNLYGNKKSIRNNFSAFLGVSFFLPSFD